MAARTSISASVQMRTGPAEGLHTHGWVTTESQVFVPMRSLKGEKPRMVELEPTGNKNKCINRINLEA